MRINRYLAGCNLGSRRACEDLVTGGVVAVNGRVVRDFATIIGETDKVTVNGRAVKPQGGFIYIIMNKPRGYITSCRDERGRKTVLDLIPQSKQTRIFPVGRLDCDTEGLLILTNDGEFANALAHPNAKIEKTYHATLDIPFRPTDTEKLQNGIDIDGEMTHPARVKILADRVVAVTVTQGRNRQVRRMFSALGYCVMHLNRVSIGKLTVGNLKIGDFTVTDLKPVI